MDISHCHLNVGSSNAKSLAGNVAVACLELAVTIFKEQDEYARNLATMIFPFVLVLRKVCYILLNTGVSFNFHLLDCLSFCSSLQSQRINLKALELSKEVKWSVYQNLMSLSNLDKVINCLTSNAISSKLTFYSNDILFHDTLND